MHDKHNYMKTRPFRSDSSRELTRGEGQKIIFQNSHHEDTISETITTNHNLHHNYNLIKITITITILSKQEIWNR